MIDISVDALGRKMVELKPYQLEGVRAIYKFGGRTLLADEMGLGKTIQALFWIHKIPAHRPAIIVCPASVKYTWQAEASLHFGMRVDVIEGRRTKKQKRLPGEIVVLNYELLHSWLPVLLAANPEVVILDEIHYIKSLKAQRTIAALELVDGIASVVGLSGTPLTNKPIELWPTILAIRPDLFENFNTYAFRYCKPRYGPWGWEYNGATHKEELHKILKDNMMIRRTKKEVLPDLPPKERCIVSMQLSSYVEYNKADKDFINWLRAISPSRAIRAERNKALTRVGYLLRLAARLKLPLMKEWIREFLECNPDKKLVALTMHTEVIEELKKEFPSMLVINGEVTGIKREEVKRRFQNNAHDRLLVGNWRAAGVGITLHAADNLAALDFPWTPGDLLQGEDRIHRIGQKNKCTIHYLTLLHTIEEKLIKILREKAAVLDAILNGEKSEEDLDIFGILLKEIT